MGWADRLWDLYFSSLDPHIELKITGRILGGNWLTGKYETKPIGKVIGLCIMWLFTAGSGVFQRSKPTFCSFIFHLYNKCWDAKLGLVIIGCEGYWPNCHRIIYRENEGNLSMDLFFSFMWAEFGFSICLLLTKYLICARLIKKSCSLALSLEGFNEKSHSNCILLVWDRGRLLLSIICGILEVKSLQQLRFNHALIFLYPVFIEEGGAIFLSLTFQSEKTKVQSPHMTYAMGRLGGHMDKLGRKCVFTRHMCSANVANIYKVWNHQENRASATSGCKKNKSILHRH